MHRETDLSLSASSNTFTKFPAFVFPPLGKVDIVDFSHGNHARRFFLFYVLRFSSCSTLPGYSARKGPGKREITSRCMIARIGCPEGSVRYAFSLASSLSSLSFWHTGALAIKTTMMTDAISVALPTGFFALHTRLYAFLWYSIQTKSTFILIRKSYNKIY